MRLRSLRLFLVPIFALCAQDAGLVLRTSVGYNTQKASLPLTDEQRKEADRLGTEAMRESQAGRHGEALRLMQQGTAVMRNVPWTAELEFASSLRGQLDHALLEPGKRATVSLSPLYTSERTSAVKLNASVSLVPIERGATGKELAGRTPVALPFTAAVVIPETAPGDYNIEVRLVPADGPAPPEASRGSFVKNIPIHIEALSSEADRLRARIGKISKKDAPSLPSAEYVLARYEQSDHGDVSPLRYNFKGEFATANAILDALEAGRDPYASKRGDFRKAYRSAVDRTIQPYRIFIPETYDGAKPVPLLVALHGMGGDENSMFDGYRETLKTEGQRVGFIVACPKGRDSASMYRGSAEQDVLDVMAEVRRDYKIDDKRIYMMGHSMGGYGTWSVAMAHPELFAALGPISGGGNAQGMAKTRDIPQYVVHGDNDKTVNVSQSRTMVEAGKKAGATIVYVEIPGGSHSDVAAPQFGPMLDFFVKQSRHGAE
jgi:predicted esterase